MLDRYRVERLSELEDVLRPAEFSEWLGRFIEAEKKDEILSFLPDKDDDYSRRSYRSPVPRYLRHFSQDSQENRGGNCPVHENEAQENTRHLHQFLSECVMSLLSKSKVIVSAPFSVSKDEQFDLAPFLLPEFKRLAVGDWGDLFPCALACSLLGETGCAVVAVPTSDLRLNRQKGIRSLLIQSGLLRRVVYLGLDDRGLDELALFIFSAPVNREKEISFSRLEWEAMGAGRRRSEEDAEPRLSYRDIHSVAPLDLLEDESRLDEGEVWRRRSLESFGSSLGKLFGIKVVRPPLPARIEEDVRRYSGEPAGKYRRLSPSDFNSEGLLIPYDPDSPRQYAAPISLGHFDDRFLKEGDVLVARIGRANTAYIVPAVDHAHGIEAYISSDNFIVLRPERPGDAPLIGALLNSKDSRNQLTGSSSSALRINLSDLMELIVPDVLQDSDLKEKVGEATEDYYEKRDALVNATAAYHQALRRLDDIVETAAKRQDKYRSAAAQQEGE